MQSLSHHWMVAIDIAIFGIYISLIARKIPRISFRRGNNFNSLRPRDINKPQQTTIGSDNGLSPNQPETIIWTNVGILLIF